MTIKRAMPKLKGSKKKQIIETGYFSGGMSGTMKFAGPYYVRLASLRDTAFCLPGV
jgi:hypothetical protein